jgi:hypothetical protein
LVVKTIPISSTPSLSLRHFIYLVYFPGGVEQTGKYYVRVAGTRGGAEEVIWALRAILSRHAGKSSWQVIHQMFQETDAIAAWNAGPQVP